jgi:hypothetical protein
LKNKVSLSVSKGLSSFETIQRDFNKLHKITQIMNYSTISYQNNYRKAENFESAQLCILDFDGETELEEAFDIFKDYQCLIVTTKSHQKEYKNGKKITKTDRFRAIIPFSTPITNRGLFRGLMKYFTERFNSDPACIDAARFYYPNQGQEVYYTRGKKKIDVNKALHKIDSSSTSDVTKKINGKHIVKISTDTNPLIVSANDEEYLASEWARTLQDNETRLIHCINKEHKDLHPSAFMAKVKYSNQIFIHCHKCGRIGYFPKQIQILQGGIDEKATITIKKI